MKPSCGETETTMRPSTSRMGWRSCKFQSRSVSRWPLNAATEKSGRLRKSNTAFGSPELVRDVASPIMRAAVQACMSSAVMRREFSLKKRFCIWIAPHWSCAPSQLVGTRPAEPAIGRGSQVR